MAKKTKAQKTKDAKAKAKVQAVADELAAAELPEDPASGDGVAENREDAPSPLDEMVDRATARQDIIDIKKRLKALERIVVDAPRLESRAAVINGLRRPRMITKIS